MSGSEEAKERVLRSIAIRQGRSKFRKKLVKAYLGKGAISGTDIECLLDAAHIVPYNGKATNNITNGILLRTDIHTLFDLGLLGIDSAYFIWVDDCLSHTEYAKYHGRNISLPKNITEWPSKTALNTRPLPHFNIIKH